MKGEHDQSLQSAKVDSNALKKEIKKLKTQVDVEAKKKIAKMEKANRVAKSTYDNVNNDNITMHQIIKNFQKDLLKKMVGKLIYLTKLHQMKRQAY